MFFVLSRHVRGKVREEYRFSESESFIEVVYSIILDTKIVIKCWTIGKGSTIYGNQTNSVLCMYHRIRNSNLAHVSITAGVFQQYK